MNSDRILGVGLAALIALCSPLVAQTGNLVPNGRFDVPDGVTGWQVINPEFNALVFDPANDADACVGSGSAHGSCDPSVDFGTGATVASPTPMFTTIFTKRGACMTLVYENFFMSAGRTFSS